jgi:RNA polymerase sigma-70 factor (ECF subfamily)
VSDEELARQCQGGAIASFEELVYRYERRLFGFLARCCRNEEDARELAQTAFVTAYRGIQSYRPDRPFGAWLFTIARRKFIDYSRGARPRLEERDDSETCDTADPSVLLAERERREDLWAKVRSVVGPDQFSALWLRYQEEMSVKDIARALNRTQTSVKVMLFRARRTLVRAAARLRPDGGTVRRAKAGAPQADGARFSPLGQTWKATQESGSLPAQVR